MEIKVPDVGEDGQDSGDSSLKLSWRERQSKLLSIKPDLMWAFKTQQPPS